eukprot:403355554
MENILYYKEYNHDSHPLYINAGDHGRYKKIETCAKNKLLQYMNDNATIIYRCTIYKKVAKMPFDFLLR